VVSCTPGSFTPGERTSSPPVRLDRFGGAQNQSERRGGQEVHDPTGTRTPTGFIEFCKIVETLVDCWLLKITASCSYGIATLFI
jgi:hypothetical protein